MRAHVWGEVDVKKGVRRAWVVLLHEAITSAGIGADDGVIKPYVQKRLEDMGLRRSASAHQLRGED